MTLPIGLQLYTVRDLLTGDKLGDTCKKVREVGYTHAEVGPFSGHTTRDVARAARAAGLTICGSHEMALIDESKSGDTLRMLADEGVSYGIVPFLGDDLRNADGYKSVARKLLALKDKVAGVEVLYHNHDFEYETLPDGRRGQDYLVHDTTLGAELDTAWVAISGHDPVAEMHKLSSRVPLIHVKDCSDFTEKTLVELGAGKVPVKDIVRAAPGVGVQVLVVEQDNNWIDGDPLKSVAISYDFLANLR